jgi:hypothetical protein
MFVYQTAKPGTITAQNSVFSFSNFYLSYNDRDVGLFGCDTTSIVLGQMQLFLTLNGDHKQALSAIATSDGLQGCIDYFIDNIDQANKRSEHVVAYSGLDLLGQPNINRITQALKDLSLPVGGSNA